VIEKFHMVHDAHLFVLSIDMQASLEPAVVLAVRNAFHGLGVQNVESLILIVALFVLDGGRRREGKKKEKKKKIAMGKEGSSRAGPPLAGCAVGCSY
jgi:hypothetical protein